MRGGYIWPCDGLISLYEEQHRVLSMLDYQVGYKFDGTDSFESELYYAWEDSEMRDS